MSDQHRNIQLSHPYTWLALSIFHEQPTVPKTRVWNLLTDIED